MRLDHIAYRVADRKRTSDFFINAFGYKIQTEFDIQFEDGTTAKCIALEPPEKTKKSNWNVLIHDLTSIAMPFEPNDKESLTEYHTAPEIFVSDGDKDSIVGKWVAARSGIGGIHHLAYQVQSVQEKMQEWQDKGYAEFTTSEPLRCPGLTQVFTKPSELTGVIYEFIERETVGFCKDNVKDLMKSTAEVK